MITIVGGTYDEFCLEPRWRERYGSGLRACRAIDSLSPEIPLEFYTFCDQATSEYLKLIPKLNVHHQLIDSTIQFYYDHPLISPRIFPRPDTFDKGQNHINAKGENVLYYGFFEGSATVEGKKIVYDPQSPVMPIPFSKTKSNAEELAYVINYAEAKLLTGTDDLQAMKRFFFEEERAKVLILKQGPQGALVSTIDGPDALIPVYKTSSVWPIGSGDVFAAAFANNWFFSNDPAKAASEASWQTACFCNSKDFQFSTIDSKPEIVPVTIRKRPNGLIYLAGPFFTFAERWLIDQVWKVFKEMELMIFSPWHDVGYGLASEVVSKDLDALEKSSIVFAVLDGLDSGTLFEIGYAVKKGIPVICYVENETQESVKMMEGTNCILEKDLTTAIYKCFWKLAENE